MAAAKRGGNSRSGITSGRPVAQVASASKAGSSPFERRGMMSPRSSRRIKPYFLPTA
jgi:hypothetical protein